MKKFLLATLAAGVWVNACEFLRNEVVFKNTWTEHFAEWG